MSRGSPEMLIRSCERDHLLEFVASGLLCQLGRERALC